MPSKYGDKAVKVNILTFERFPSIFISFPALSALHLNKDLGAQNVRLYICSEEVMLKQLRDTDYTEKKLELTSVANAGPESLDLSEEEVVLDIREDKTAGWNGEPTSEEVPT